MSYSKSVTDPTLFPKWLPDSTVTPTDLFSHQSVLVTSLGLKSHRVTHGACPNPSHPQALLALPSPSEHLLPTTTPGEILPPKDRHMSLLSEDILGLDSASAE